MDYGNHLSALIAIIVGLAVTELLAGVSRALRTKGRPGFTWFPFVQAFLIATILLVFWLASFAELSSGKYLGVFAFSTQLVRRVNLAADSGGIYEADKNALGDDADDRGDCGGFYRSISWSLRGPRIARR